MSGWLKRLRKRLRKKKPSLLLASILLTVGIISGLWYTIKSSESQLDDINLQETALTIPAQEYEILLRKFYTIGPMTEEKLKRSAESVEVIQKEFPEWELVAEENGRLIFKEMVNDLSPVLKKNGVFGLTSAGVLTVFEGDPRDEKVIHTFFQLDIERLESGLPKEEYLLLQNGIPFSTLAEFNSILSTYGEYALIDGVEEVHSR